MSTRQTIKRGILQSFDPTTYTATVLVGSTCAVLFFDESNYTDAVILAIS